MTTVRALFAMGLLTATALPTAVAAQSPATYGNVRASYGPLTACIGGYALSVRAGEGVSAILGPDGDAVRMLIRTEGGELLRIGWPGDEQGVAAHRRPIRLASGVAARRFDFAAAAGFRDGIPGEAVGFESPAHREYELSATGDRPALRVTSAHFASPHPARDRAILDRIGPRAGAACAELASSDRPDHLPTADVLSPRRVTGPAQICHGGIAFALVADERINLTWPAHGVRDLLITLPDGMLRLSGRQDRRSAPRRRTPIRDAGMDFLPYPQGSGGVIQSRQRDRAGFVRQIYVGYAGAGEAAVNRLMDRMALAARGEKACWSNNEDN